jgi:hypothetical protein
LTARLFGRCEKHCQRTLRPDSDGLERNSHLRRGGEPPVAPRLLGIIGWYFLRHAWIVLVVPLVWAYMRVAWVRGRGAR